MAAVNDAVVFPFIGKPGSEYFYNNSSSPHIAGEPKPNRDGRYSVFAESPGQLYPTSGRD